MTYTVPFERLVEYKNFAIQLAQKAGEIMKKYNSINISMEWKSDNTPITIADKEINQMVLDNIKKKYPSHSTIAEEGSFMAKGNNDVWVCDPIDGTVPFSHGYPLSTFAIAFVKNGEVLMGIIFDPMSDRLASAIIGKGTLLNGQKISVSTEKEITERSIIEINAEYKLLHLREVLLKKTGCYSPVFYSAAYSCLLVATGNFLGQIFEYNNPWDAAAAKIIVEEAGGKVTDLSGKEQRYDQKINGFIASNKLVHHQLLDLVSESKTI